MQDCKISILGTEYPIYFVDEFPERLKEVGENAEGLCGRYDKEIYVIRPSDKDLTDDGRDRRMKQVLRHEILHCYLEESGLSADANVYADAWPENEEMVDWFTIQSPKIFKTFTDLGLL